RRWPGLVAESGAAHQHDERQGNDQADLEKAHQRSARQRRPSGRRGWRCLPPFPRALPLRLLLEARQPNSHTVHAENVRIGLHPGFNVIKPSSSRTWDLTDRCAKHHAGAVSLNNHLPERSMRLRLLALSTVVMVVCCTPESLR